MSNIFDFNGARAADNPIENVQLNQDPLVTELVLGQPQATFIPGTRLFPSINVQNWVFEYTTLSNEHLGRYETERSMRAPILHGDWSAQTTPAKLRRYSFRILKDIDELTNAHPTLRIRERSAALARRIVMMNLERNKRDLAVLAASYPGGHDVTLGGGSEWDSAGGDSRTNVRTATAALSTATGLMPSDFSVFLSLSSFEAALSDPVFLAARGNYTTDIADEVILQKYWGTGPVFVGNPVEEIAGIVTPMYADVAILFYDGSATGMSTDFGDLTWSANFTWNRGVASSPWFDPVHTSWSFPWTEYSHPTILTPNSGYIIRNTAA